MPATSLHKAKPESGYVNVGQTFNMWFQAGFGLCLALCVLYVIMAFVKVDKDNQ